MVECSNFVSHDSLNQEDPTDIVFALCYTNGMVFHKVLQIDLSKAKAAIQTNANKLPEEFEALQGDGKEFTIEMYDFKCSHMTHYQSAKKDLTLLILGCVDEQSNQISFYQVKTVTNDSKNEIAFEPVASENQIKFNILEDAEGKKELDSQFVFKVDRLALSAVAYDKFWTGKKEGIWLYSVFKKNDYLQFRPGRYFLSFSSLKALSEKALHKDF